MAIGEPRIDRVFQFGQYELSEREGELRKNGVRIRYKSSRFKCWWNCWPCGQRSDAGTT